MANMFGHRVNQVDGVEVENSHEGLTSLLKSGSRCTRDEIQWWLVTTGQRYKTFTPVCPRVSRWQPINRGSLRNINWHVCGVVSVVWDLCSCLMCCGCRPIRRWSSWSWTSISECGSGAFCRRAALSSSHFTDLDSPESTTLATAVT